MINSTLQILPQMQAKAQTIIAAQRSRGLNTEGSLLIALVVAAFILRIWLS